MKKEVFVEHSHSAGGVVINPTGRVLCVSQRGTSWSLPKGHIHADEDLVQAAIREIAEESGLTHLMFIRSLGTYQRYRIGPDGDDPSELKTLHMFLFRTDETDLHPTDPDNPEARWVEVDKVAELLTHQKDKDFFLGIIDGLR
jgi:ADP-ribose pyrophosphatase YjhB (NUDIX family)